MVHQSKINNASSARFILGGLSDSEAEPAVGTPNVLKGLFKQYHLSNLDDFKIKLGTSAGKKSFLVFKNNKYISILTENIAYFSVRYDSTIIVTFDSRNIL